MEMGKVSFVTDIFGEEEANVIVLGVPIGKGTKKTIQKLREVSRFVEPFDVVTKRNLLKNVRIFDKGDVKLKKLSNITQSVKRILQKDKVPLILGGNHLLTYYTLKAYHNLGREVKILVFDAHADLKDEYLDKKIKEMNYVKGIRIDKKLNDATWLRRVLEWQNPKNVFLAGIRSLDEDEFSFIKDNAILYLTSSEIKKDLMGSANTLRRFTQNSNVYVSLDIDVFDPSVAPDTYYPEPDGLLFEHFKQLIEAVAGKVVGIDLCCVKTSKNNVTEMLAVRCLFEILSKV